jgi:hypothetical protein
MTPNTYHVLEAKPVGRPRVQMLVAHTEWREDPAASHYFPVGSENPRHLGTVVIVDNDDLVTADMFTSAV